MIGLVGCGKSKLPGTHPARELYTGQLFRWSLQWALRTCDAVYILSAKHGLLELDTPVEAYDLALTQLSLAERAAWGVRVVEQLAGRGPFYALAGAPYVQTLAKLGLPVQHDPLRGMQIGERLSWLKRNLYERA